MTTSGEDVRDEVIIHVFVVGFHHKKGCVVEFSYPPISSGCDVGSAELPEPWKHLPTLALPDGSHNYDQDTIFFHLPSLENPSQTVFGISCYRQMNAKHLLRRSSDITRETVQKSVCVLSRLPLFGLIQAKLELITHAYFDERDFSKVSLLEETYRNLNSSLPKDIFDGQHAFLGLSAREFILRFKNGALLLFKLLLLEKKVLFYKAPVKNLCSTVLTLCSLIPGMIEGGLNEAATSLAPKHITDSGSEDDGPPAQNQETASFDLVNSSQLDNSLNNNSLSLSQNDLKDTAANHCDNPSENVVGDGHIASTGKVSDLSAASGSDAEKQVEPLLQNDDAKLLDEIDQILNMNDDQSKPEPAESDKNSSSESVDGKKSSDKNGEGQSLEQQRNDMQIILDIEPSDCGLPLSVFTKGMLCYPYLSLPFLDLLSDLSVRGFVVGATNILFKQKKHLFDVVVEVEEGKIFVADSELRKQLHLTTEDLRFTDHLVRHVMEDKEDVFLDGTGWEGGDEWLRAQFKLYLLSLMRASHSEGKDIDSYDCAFVNSWKLTHNYRMWARRIYTKVLDLSPVHPFHGQLSMSDMKLKLSHSMQNSEKGRRINSAVTSTGKAVLQTGKVVGGAFSNAKSAVSSWWSNFGVQQPATEKREEKNAKDNNDPSQKGSVDVENREEDSLDVEKLGADS